MCIYVGVYIEELDWGPDGAEEAARGGVCWAQHPQHSHCEWEQSSTGCIAQPRAKIHVPWGESMGMCAMQHVQQNMCLVAYADMQTNGIPYLQPTPTHPDQTVAHLVISNNNNNINNNNKNRLPTQDLIIIKGLSLLQSIPPTTANKQTQAQKKGRAWLENC